MHMLDKDLINVIPAIKYALHLPRFCFDVIDCPEEIMLKWNGNSHNILLIPDSQIEKIEHYFVVFNHIQRFLLLQIIVILML